MGVAINAGGDRRGQNPPMDLPFPSLGGLLVQSSLWGLNYPALSRRRKTSVAVGSRYDWSEQGRHLASLGAASMKNYGFDAATGLVAPTTADSVDAMAPGGEITIVVIARSYATAKPINLARTANGSPLEIQMSLFGATPRLEARQTAGETTATATVMFSAAAMTGFCMFATSYSATKRAAHFRPPGGALVSAEDTTALAFGSPDPLEFGIESSGSGDAVNTLTAEAIYAAYLTPAQLVAVHDPYSLFIQRIGSPFTA